MFSLATLHLQTRELWTRTVEPGSGPAASLERSIHELGCNHPFLFYRRLGYVVTGIMPDANGPGKPDIYMSKSARL